MSNETNETNGADETHEASDALDPRTLVHAVQDLKAWLDTLGRAIQLGGFPSQLPAPNLMLLQVAMSLVALRSQREFYATMVELVAHMVGRTEAGSGAIDARAFTSMMTHLRMAVALGPDPETIMEVAKGAQHELAIEMQRTTHQRERLDVYRAIVAEILARPDVPEEARARLASLQEGTGPAQGPGL